jgi:hypothetical protein
VFVQLSDSYCVTAPFDALAAAQRERWRDHPPIGFCLAPVALVNGVPDGLVDELPSCLCAAAAMHSRAFPVVTYDVQ